MIYAERGNRVKQISEADIQKYLEQGYKITDDRGTVVMESVPMDTQTLRNAYRQHTDEIKALKAQIEYLTSELAKVQTVAVAEEPKKEKALVIEDAKPSKKKKAVETADAE